MKKLFFILFFSVFCFSGNAGECTVSTAYNGNIELSVGEYTLSMYVSVNGSNFQSLSKGQYAVDVHRLDTETIEEVIMANTYRIVTQTLVYFYENGRQCTLMYTVTRTPGQIAIRAW